MFGALKRWREAEEFFEIVVTAPGHVAAAIQLEALKKLTLVQLILYGKVFMYPLEYAGAGNAHSLRFFAVNPGSEICECSPFTAYQKLPLLHLF